MVLLYHYYHVLKYQRYYKREKVHYMCVSKGNILTLNWPAKSINCSRQSMGIGVVISRKKLVFEICEETRAFDNPHCSTPPLPMKVQAPLKCWGTRCTVQKHCLYTTAGQQPLFWETETSLSCRSFPLEFSFTQFECNLYIRTTCQGTIFSYR